MRPMLVGAQRRVTRVSATLYAVYTSHPAHAARLMLEHKGIEHKVVNLVPGTHAAALRALGFRRGTVPALRLDGRRIQGTRAISRALDEAQPEPPLFPADPQERIRVEEAERWGDDVLQPVPRRIGGWVFANRPEMRTRLAREAGLPAPRLLGPAGWPLTWYFARKVGANDTERVRRTVEMLPALLDHVDELARRGDDRRRAAQRRRLPDRDLGPAADDVRGPGAGAGGPQGGALRHRADARLPDGHAGGPRPAGMARAPSRLTRLRNR